MLKTKNIYSLDNLTLQNYLSAATKKSRQDSDSDRNSAHSSTEQNAIVPMGDAPAPVVENSEDKVSATLGDE